jgi:spermidine synthase
MSLAIDYGAAPRHGLATALMLASGFAGLGYQIIWTQQFALCLGSDSASVLAVVAAFFAGLAAGALVLGSRVERSAHPQRWYAAAEALVGAWSLLLAVTMAPVSGAVLHVIGVQPAPIWQWSVAFAGTFLLLLPATAAMGVTLPAMERAVAAQAREGRSIAGLYAANTLGAVVGVLAIALWLVPRFGLLRASCACVVFSLLAALIAVRAWDAPSGKQAPATPMTADAVPALWRLAATGFLGIGFEILVVRVLSQVAEDTVYTFALLLACYLVGTALGAYAYRRAGAAGDARVRNRLLLLLGLACLASTAFLYASEQVKAWVLDGVGGGFRPALAAEAALALLAFALPTAVMGALFSHQCREAHGAGVTFGRAIGINTLGAALAPVVFGVLVVPGLGPKLALLAICTGYLLLGAGAGRRSPWPWLALAACAAFAAFAPPLAFVELPEGARLVSYRDGVTASVSVVEDAGGISRLRINNRQQEGANASRRVDGRQALLPMLLHPAPRRALFLGVGAGNTSATAAEEPGVEVDAVELLPEVIEAAERFTAAFPPEVRARLHFIPADARRYVKTAERQYDVVVADNFHPARSGTGSLYTTEHFLAVRARLAPAGLFCQWLPLHQLDIGSLQSIARSFLAAFPHAYALIASNSLGTPTVGLLGLAEDRRLDRGQASARLGAYGTPARRAEFGVEDEFALLGGFIAGPSSLARFAGDAPLNTDDYPVIAYGAPRITYAPDSTPVERLVALLAAASITPGELVDADGDEKWAGRLAAYWVARNKFIDSGRVARPKSDPSAMLDQVQEPLLRVLRTSPDFRPAYDPLLRLAEAVARSDGDRARRILGELATLQPQRTEAASALAELAERR